MCADSVPRCLSLQVRGVPVSNDEDKKEDEAKRAGHAEEGGRIIAGSERPES